MQRAPALASASFAWLMRAGVARACAEHGDTGDTRALLAATEAHWSPDPWVMAGMLVSAACYGFGLKRLWQHAGRAHGLRWGHVLAFALGWSAVAFALLSPLDPLSDVLFSAHMTQHELLMLLAAPLMVLARPWLALLWAMPARGRVRSLELVGRPRVRRAWRAASHPALALGVHGLTLWLWHVPALFAAALESEAVHALQHATFFFTAALFFWALFDGRYGRAGYGASAVFVFLTALHSGVLGALLTVASGLWYPIHAARTDLWGLCALADQQLAGLIMWIPAGAALLVIALALFAAWLRESERRARRARTLAFERDHGT